MDDADIDPDPDEVPLEQALEAIARRLAGVTAAVDGFAERQQLLLGRDYSEDLALIHQSCEDLREAIDALADKPALALTPEMIARQIEVAGRQFRNDTNTAISNVRTDMQNAIGALNRMTASARTVRQQNQWLAGAASLALVLGAIGGCTLPPLIDWVAPENWHWPEHRAMSALHRRGWDAGERLLSVADPDRWSSLRAANLLLEGNSEAIARCTRRAADRKLKSVRCSVEIPSQHH